MTARKKQSAPSTPWSPDRAIVLVGMMGAGKTTVGRRLAPKLGLPFYDADEQIERAAGMSVNDLFLRHGEESFRRGEAQVIARLLSGPAHVLATGGGAVIDPETRALIRAHAISVWLKADVDVLLRRASRRATRPLLKTPDPRATLQRLLAERTPYYAQANIVVDAALGAHAHTVAAIMDALAAWRLPGSRSAVKEDA